jgi:hypothetical protein
MNQGLPQSQQTESENERNEKATMMDKLMPQDPSQRDMTIKRTDCLMTGDLRNLLTGFAAAIKWDQLCVDALPAWTFHIHYNPGMWSRWRNDHLDFIEKLMATTNEVPNMVLVSLTWIAQNYDPAVVAHFLLDLLAEAASGSVEETELLPAARFFEHLIRDVSRQPARPPNINTGARSLAALWFPISDPLRIAADPECGYRIAATTN